MSNKEPSLNCIYRPARHQAPHRFVLGGAHVKPGSGLGGARAQTTRL